MDLSRFPSLGARGSLTFANGDKATGYAYEEEGTAWFRAIDANGREYDTEEMPAERLPITIVCHTDGTRYLIANKG